MFNSFIVSLNLKRFSRYIKISIFLKGTPLSEGDSLFVQNRSRY